MEASGTAFGCPAPRLFLPPPHSTGVQQRDRNLPKHTQSHHMLMHPSPPAWSFFAAVRRAEAHTPASLLGRLLSAPPSPWKSWMKSAEVPQFSKKHLASPVFWRPVLLSIILTDGGGSCFLLFPLCSAPAFWQSRVKEFPVAPFLPLSLKRCYLLTLIAKIKVFVQMFSVW